MPSSHLGIAGVLFNLVTKASDNARVLQGLLMDRRFQRLTLALADANGLYYAAAQQIKQMNVPLFDTERWNLELENIVEIKKSIATLNSVTNNSDLRYILIKEYRAIPNVARDVDILIHEDDRNRLIEELNPFGFSILHNNPAEISLEGMASRRIDMYTGIRYFGKDFIREELLWDACEMHSSHDVLHPGLSPPLNLLVNSIHGIFGHPYLTLLDYLDISDLMRDPGNLDCCRRMAAEAGWLDLLEEWFRRINDLQVRVGALGKRVKFPMRNGIFLTLRNASQIEGMKMSPGVRLTLISNLLWDDTIYVAEKSGIYRALKSSKIASGMANRVGHSLRQMRGDTKYGNTSKNEENEEVESPPK